MKTIKFETKEQLYQLCKDICSTQRSFYKESVDVIEQHGATVKIDYLFCCGSEYIKYPDLNKRCALMICSSIHPATNSISHSERTHTCQYYYSKVGVLKKMKDSAYMLCVNKHEDKGMTMFFKRYTKRLIKKTADVALKQRISDVVANVIFPKRQGSSFNKTYRGFPIKAIIIIVLLVLLFIIRLAIPTGYHPSLK